MIPTMGTDTFNEWLLQELKARDWTQADLARQAGVSRSAISDIMSSRRKIGIDVANSLADALHIPADQVFRAAGILPAEKKLNPRIAQIVEELEGTSPEEQQEFLSYIRWRNNQRKKK